MKKIMTLSFSFVLALSVAAFAQPSQKDMEKMEKERQEMTQLVEKYNKATSDKKKEEIKAKIQAKVAANYDKHLERMEERLKDSETKIAQAKEKLAQSKTPEFKAKHIEEITQGIISGKDKPMFGMPPAFDKGMKGHKKHHKGFFNKDKKGGCPFAKAEGKDGKKCPFAKEEGKDGKDCPCMKGFREGFKDQKFGKEPKFGKGPVAELPVIKEKPQEI